MLDLFQYAFIWQALIAAVLTLSASALMSFTVVSHKQSFFTHGISQSMFLGVAVGAAFGIGGLIPGIASALVAAITIYAMQKIKWVPQDARIAVTASLFFALGIIVLNSSDSRSVSVSNILFGNILGVTGSEIIILAALALACFIFFGIFGSKLQFIAQNPKAAQAAGINVRNLEIVRIVAVATVAAVSIPVVGVVMIVAAAVLPALIGFTWSRHYKWSLAAALISALSSGILGIMVSYFLDIPTGPTIVVSMILIWFAALGLSALMPRLKNLRKTPQT